MESRYYIGNCKEFARASFKGTHQNIIDWEQIFFASSSWRQVSSLRHWLHPIIHRFVVFFTYRNDESRLWRAWVLAQWIPLSMLDRLLDPVPFSAGRLGEFSIMISGKVEDLEVEEGIRPDEGLTFWTCLVNYWKIGPWQTAWQYEQDEAMAAEGDEHYLERHHG